MPGGGAALGSCSGFMVIDRLTAFQDGDRAAIIAGKAYICAMPVQNATPGVNGFPGILGLWSAVAVLIGSTIGSGIFRVPASVAERLQYPGPVLLAWVLGGLIALFGALTLAELAGRSPARAGSSPTSSRRLGRCRHSCSAGPSSP